MEAILSSPLFGLFLSVLSFGIGSFLFSKFKTPILNPLLFAIICCVVFIESGIISYDKYMTDNTFLTNLLPVATALLAVNIYKQGKQIIYGVQSPGGKGPHVIRTLEDVTSSRW